MQIINAKLMYLIYFYNCKLFSINVPIKVKKRKDWVYRMFFCYEKYNLRQVNSLSNLTIFVTRYIVYDNIITTSAMAIENTLYGFPYVIISLNDVI